MTLFESDSQYREKLTIWRIMSLLPLYGSIAGGHIWRWFAVNIPMDLGTGSREPYTSDIDIIARLSDFPNSKNWFYKTWEVKVSLLNKDGVSRSLKIGKLKKTTNQLKAYRNFGAPLVNLLEVFVCENGYMFNNEFPPEKVQNAINLKETELKSERFGYQFLAFEHGKDGEDDLGLLTLSKGQPLGNNNIHDVLVSENFGHRQPFSRLVDDMDNFFEKIGERPRKHFHQIVYCKKCRQLQLINMKEEYECPNCKDDLIAQT